MEIYWADELTKVFDNGRVNGNPLKPAKQGIDLYGAGGETVSFQLVLFSADGITDEVTVEFSPLGRGNQAVPEEAFEAFRVGFVRTPAAPYLGDKPAAWSPDPLFSIEPFRVLHKDYQPVWINLTIPSRRSGTYRGNLLVRAQGQKEIRIPVRLRIWGFNLPHEPSLINALDFSLADKVSGFEQLYGRVNGPGFPVLEKFLRYLHSRKMNTLIYNHLLFDSGLLKIKKQGGKFVTDFSGVKNILALMRELQLRFNLWASPIWPKPEIFCDLYPFLESFRSLGEKLYGDPGFIRYVLDAAANVQGYLTRKGMADQSFAYFWDEPHQPWHGDHLAMLSRKFKALCPRVRQVTAVGDPAYIQRILTEDLPVDIVVGHLSYYDPAIREQLRQTGRDYWWYTSNWSSSHLSFWVDEPALHHRILYWLTWRYKVPAFVYWNTNTWNYITYGYENVDAGRKMEWPYSPWRIIGTPNNHGAADGQLVYPGPDGPIGSIRMEVIRHGCQDHQYLSLLETAVSGSTGRKKLGAEALMKKLAQRTGRLRSHLKSPAVLLRLKQETGKMLETLIPN